MRRLAPITGLGILGWFVSYAFFGQWLLNSGGDFIGGWVGAFTAHTFAMGLLSDLVVVTAMMVVVAVVERRRIGTLWSVAMVASLGLSVSMSLAIYLVRVWQMQGGRDARSGSVTRAHR